jgi:hypothetical protein
MDVTGNGNEQLKVLRRAAKSPRDEWLVVLGAVLGLGSPELRTLTLSKARVQLGKLNRQDGAAALLRALERYAKAEGLRDDGLLFQSTTSFGQLDRTAVWRIISGMAKKAFGKSSGGIQLLGRIHKAIMESLNRPQDWFLGIGEFWKPLAPNQPPGWGLLEVLGIEVAPDPLPEAEIIDFDALGGVFS